MISDNFIVQRMRDHEFEIYESLGKKHIEYLILDDCSVICRVMEQVDVPGGYTYNHIVDIK